MLATELQSLDLPGHRIAWVETSSRQVPASASPLVLLHGGAVDHRMWSPQQHAFPERRVLAPDARGHGGSSDADRPYRLADDVVNLLDALGIGKAVLVGVSMGGGTAVDVALEHPSRVAGLVISGTGTSEPEFTDTWSIEAFTAWKQAEIDGDADGWVEAFMRFAHGPHRDPEEIHPEVWQLVKLMAAQTLQHHLRLDAQGNPVPPTQPTPVTDTWARLSQVAVPVLALPGALDSSDHRALGRRLVDSVPTGDYQEIPGAAHYPNLESPDLFNAAVSEFLRRYDI